MIRQPVEIYIPEVVMDSLILLLVPVHYSCTNLTIVLVDFILFRPQLEQLRDFLNDFAFDWLHTEMNFHHRGLGVISLNFLDDIVRQVDGRVALILGARTTRWPISLFPIIP